MGKKKEKGVINMKPGTVLDLSKKKDKKTIYKNRETMTVTIRTKSRFINPMRQAFKEAKKISKANPGMKVNFIAELDLTDEGPGF